MSSIVHKVKDAIRGDDTDHRYASNTYRPHDASSRSFNRHPDDDDDDYGTSTTTTTGTTTHVTRSRTPATNDEYDTNNTVTPSSRHVGAGNSSLSPSSKQGLAATSARSEPPPLPGREPPSVPGRGGNYVPSTDTHTGPTGANVGSGGDRIGEALTGKPSVPHTGTYNHTSDNRGLVDRSKLMDPASKDAGSNVMETNSNIVSPTTTREDKYDDNNGKYGSIHDLRKSHEKRDGYGDGGKSSERNNAGNIFGTGASLDHRHEHDHRNNTLGDHTNEHQHGNGLTAQQRENRDANIAGATGPLGLAASSSINRRAVGGGNSNRDSLVGSNDVYRNDPAVRTHLDNATTGTTLPHGGIHNGIIGNGSGRDLDQSGQHNFGRSTGNNNYDSKTSTVVPAVGPAPKAANDHRFDDRDDRFGDGNTFDKKNTRYGNGTGLGHNRSAFNDSRFDDNSRFGPNESTNSNIDGVSIRNNNDTSGRRGRNTDEFGRVLDDDNNDRNRNTFDRNNNEYGRTQNTFDRNRTNNSNWDRNQNSFDRNDDSYNNRNYNRNSQGMFDSRSDDNYNRNSGGVFNNRNDNYNSNRNNDNYGNNRFNNSGSNQPWNNGPRRSGTGQLVTSVFGNPSTGLDHYGPGYNGSKVMHECDHCGNDTDITHYFRKDAVYRLHRV